MTDDEILTAAKAAFKAFDALVVNQAIDLTKRPTWKADKQVMKDICTTYIDGQRVGGCDTHEMNYNFTIIKRISNG